MEKVIEINLYVSINYGYMLPVSRLVKWNLKKYSYLLFLTILAYVSKT